MKIKAEKSDCIPYPRTSTMLEALEASKRNLKKNRAALERAKQKRTDLRELRESVAIDSAAIEHISGLIEARK